MKKTWFLSFPLSAQRRFWSDWAYAQAYLSLRWVHTYFVGFVMSWLIWHSWYLSSPKLEPNHKKSCLYHMRTTKAQVSFRILAFVVRCLDSIIPPASIAKFSSLYLAFEAAQAGLSLPWSQIPKTCFLLWRCWHFSTFVSGTTRVSRTPRWNWRTWTTCKFSK